LLRLGVQPALRLFDSNAGAKARQDHQRMVSTIGGLCDIQLQRHPSIHAVAHANRWKEVVRHYAHYATHRAIHGYRFTGNTRIGAKPVSPQTSAHQHRAIPIFFRQKGPAEHGLHAESLEVISRD
jgi:hypothetical protein